MDNAFRPGGQVIPQSVPEWARLTIDRLFESDLRGSHNAIMKPSPTITLLHPPLKGRLAVLLLSLVCLGPGPGDISARALEHRGEIKVQVPSGSHFEIATDVWANHTDAYVLTSDHVLRFDITNHRNPVYLGVLPGVQGGIALMVRNQIMYVAGDYRILIS